MAIFLLDTLLLLISLLSLAHATTATSSSEENCLGIDTVEDRGYHEGCDLFAFNRYKGSLKKKAMQKRLTESGIHDVPDETTVVCPVQEVNLKKPNMIRGQDTMWIVESVASSPVVLAFVNEDGVEYSAVNRKVTPPQADPQAILVPGSWKALHVFEGEIFHVRQLVGGVPGPIVLQHRAGLLPIDKKTKATRIQRNNMITQQESQRLESNRQRKTQRFDFTVCNIVDVGFRNYAREPLEGYWLDPTPGHCQEHHKMHLGTNTKPKNFAFDFDSNTKFEKSYIGHTFVFRSSATSELIATYTLAPTLIRDCPSRSTTTAKVLVSGDVQPIELGNKMATEINITNELGEYLQEATDGDEELEMLQSANATIRLVPFRPPPGEASTGNE